MSNLGIFDSKTAFTDSDDILKDAISMGLNPKQISLKIRIEQALKNKVFTSP